MNKHGTHGPAVIMNGTDNRQHQSINRQITAKLKSKWYNIYKELLNKQRSKLTSKLTPESYTKHNPRKGFTPVLSDWIKGLVLSFGVNLWCYPKIKWPNVNGDR